MVIRPAGWPPMETSKYTLFVTSALHSRGAVSAVAHVSASAGATAAAAAAAAEPTSAARRDATRDSEASSREAAQRTV